MFDRKLIETIYDQIAQRWSNHTKDLEFYNKQFIENNSRNIFAATTYEQLILSSVSFGGHLKGKYDRLTLREILLKDNTIFERFHDKAVKIIEKFFVFYKKKTITKKDFCDIFEDSLVFFSPVSLYCHCCGESFYVAYNNGIFDIAEIDGTLSKHPCKAPEKEIIIESKIKFPSGKMVIANNLCHVFDTETINASDEYIKRKSGLKSGICTDKGKMLNHEYWNKLGLLYAFTGNSNPTLYSTKDGDFHLRDHHVENEDEIVQITTDLWAFCAMDYNVLERLCKKKRIDINEFLINHNCSIIDVDGNITYKVNNYLFTSEPSICSITRIGN